jgi:hypothetical protein
LFEFRGAALHSKQVRWGTAKFADSRGMQELVNGFERAKEAGKTSAQVGRGLAGWHEIALPELIGNGDDSGAHRPVFVRALRPDHAFF